MAAILSRLLLVLALSLFSAHQGVTDGPDRQFGPAVMGETTYAPVILKAQSHLMRVHLPDSDTPHLVTPATDLSARRQETVAQVSHGQGPHPSPFEIHILPPARGPPAV
jgi:hypothetical protein